MKGGVFQAVLVITGKHRDGFAVRGHRVPCSWPGSDQQRVRAALLAVCNALGYREGPLNFDVMLAPGSTTVIELSPRCGGNGLPSLIRRSTGIDLERTTLELALGHDPCFPEDRHIVRGCGSVVIGSNAAGVIQSLAMPEAIRRAVPEVFEVGFAKKPGDRVLRFEHGGDTVGCVLFDCDSAEAYERIGQNIRRAVSLTLA